MASIEERTAPDGSKAYRVKVRLKGHPPQTATFARKTDAKRWAQDTESAIREGRHFRTSEAKRHTVADLLDRYSANVLPAKRDRVNQTRQLAWWRARIGAYTLADVTPALLSEARDALANDGRSPATVNRYLAALSHPFTIAAKEYGWIDANPMLNVRRAREPRGRVRYLAPDELARLLDACRDEGAQRFARTRTGTTDDALPPEPNDLYVAVILSVATGARQSEILGLRWSQIDLDARRITLHETKNGERRALHLDTATHDLLRARSRVRRIDTDLLFPPARDPKKPSPGALRSPFERALKRAGIEDFRWHDLRHTTASYLAMSGASLAEIAEVLGHKTLSMVKRYAHLSDGHVASVVSRMSEKFLAGAIR